MRQPVRALVGLGSNVGDRRASMARAVSLLRGAPNVTVAAVSALYETPPWGYTAQAPFLNAVVAVDTTLGPRQLLIALKSFEARIGRRRTFRWGPRVIDLDVLAYDDVTLERPGLSLPHPAIPDRAFVLVPLGDLEPGYRAPDGRTLPELLRALDTGGVKRVEGPTWA